MEHTARFQIPLLAPGQAQKEFYHNEALERIGMLLCPVVEGGPQAAPPADPVIGACYLVAAGGIRGMAGTGWRDCLLYRRRLALCRAD